MYGPVKVFDFQADFLHQEDVMRLGTEAFSERSDQNRILQNFTTHFINWIKFENIPKVLWELPKKC